MTFTYRIIFSVFLSMLNITLMAQDNSPFGHKEIIYKTIDNDDLLLHVFSPKSLSSPVPLTVFLHPGGWIMGSPASFFDDCEKYALLGHVTVSVEYKLANFTSRSPMDCLDDVIAALKYLHEHSEELKADMSKLSIVGYSAGAHLALMSQLVSDLDVPIAHRLILYSTPVDLRDDKLAPQLIKRDETLASISPITYLRKIPSEIYMFHGAKDFMVSVDHAKVFAERSEKIGNSILLDISEDANHFLLTGNAKDNIHMRTMEILFPNRIK